MVQQVKWKSAPAPSTHSPFPVVRGPEWTTGINGSERQRPFHKSIHKTTAVGVGRRRKKTGGVFGSPSVERVFYFVSLFFYFNFYFNWNNIIPRSSHELSLTQRQHTSCANGVRLFGFELGLLVSATVAGCLSRSPRLPVSRSSLLLYPCRSLNRAEGIVNYPIVYCGNGKEDWKQLKNWQTRIDCDYSKLLSN